MKKTRHRREGTSGTAASLGRVESEAPANVDSIAVERIRRMLREAEADIAYLIPDVFSEDPNVAFVVADPDVNVDDGPAARAMWTELRMRTNGKPAVALVPVPEVLEMLDGSPELAFIGEILRAPRRLCDVPVVLMSGDVHGIGYVCEAPPPRGLRFWAPEREAPRRVAEESHLGGRVHLH